MDCQVRWRKKHHPYPRNVCCKRKLRHADPEHVSHLSHPVAAWASRAKLCGQEVRPWHLRISHLAGTAAVHPSVSFKILLTRLKECRDCPVHSHRVAIRMTRMRRSSSFQRWFCRSGKERGIQAFCQPRRTFYMMHAPKTTLRVFSRDTVWPDP